jgi:hypothetical protein
MDEVTRILSAIERGDEQAAERFLPLVYDLVSRSPRPAPRPDEGQDRLTSKKTRVANLTEAAPVERR